MKRLYVLLCACDEVAFGLCSATSNDFSVSEYMSGGSIAVVVMKLNWFQADGLNESIVRY